MRIIKIYVAIIIILAGGLLFAIYKARDYRSHTNYFLDRYTYVVSEFSGRDKYQAENDRFISDKIVPRRVVFIGDQIVENWDLPRYFPDYEVINRGIGGQRLAGFLLRLKPDVLDLGPRAAIIEFSSYNFRPQNSVRELEDYTVSLARLCRAAGVEPFLTTVIPVGKKTDPYESEMFKNYAVTDSIAEFNAWLRKICQKENYSIVDFNKTLSDENGFLSQEFFIDNNHLTEAGYGRLAEQSLKALTEFEEESSKNYGLGSANVVTGKN